MPSSKKPKVNIKWTFTATIISFVTAMSLGSVSEILLSKAGLLMAFILLIIIILLGVVFDIIGIAAAAAEEKPFHSMASNKVTGAKHAIKLIRNAGVVSNFCNDIMGDICNILSGTIVGIMLLELSKNTNFDRTIISAVLSSLVAAMTIGLKAAEKNIAVSQSNDIILLVGKLLYWLSHYLKIDLFRNKK
ncbi:hypothetical protein SAMN02746089_00406 [Caldanaerobius fijiensis DSM 17918]|uniref:CNNM transmembrane domain-containing protein n=1 Tax=Caldanaerobius fijiensis DSM 17918 TaxID=1121256 RepID=A0A1M4U828_9THEO|nr:hypothetical protein [Caldanaerobius fijiensis]SHE52875.1 hypothetical protein SAMN02746089_00406 [Caldanaerobius fijiensis DSM 17918]